jgi:acetyl-CoA C-acetyltransferase
MTELNDAYIVAPVRTPIGKFGGALRPLTADALMVRIVEALMARTGIPGETLDDVIVSQSYASSEAPCLGRYGALAAGLPIEVPGYTLDRRCGSGLQAVINAAMTIQTGQAQAVMVVGVESMSNIEYYTTDMRWGSRAGSVTLHDRLDRGRVRSQPEVRFGVISGMPETADTLAREYEITRAEADAFAARRGHSPGHHGREPRRLAYTAPGRGLHCGQFEPAKRCRGGLPRRLGHLSRTPRPDTNGTPAGLGRGRMRSRADGDRPGSGNLQGA